MTADPRLRLTDLPALDEAVSDATPATLANTVWKIVFVPTVYDVLPNALLFTFRGRSWRQWDLPGTSVDDELVRAIARREQAEAVVVVHDVPVPPQVDARRTTAIAVESKQGKFDQLIPLKTYGNFRILFREYPAAAELRWLGVEPQGDVPTLIARAAGPLGTRAGEA